MSFLRHGILGIALLLPVLTAVAEERPVSAQTVHFDVRPQPMEQALTDFAKQADVRIIFFPETVQGFTAVRVSGAYTPQDALKILLADSALSYRFTDTRTVTVSAAGEGTAAQVVDGSGTLRVAQAETAASPSPAAGEGAPQGADEEKKESSISEVVVTAQRREERLVDAPLSVAVIGGEELDTLNGRGVGEALSRVPGVNNAIAGGNARAGNASGTVIIRGVAPLAGASPTAYYLDSVPFGFVAGGAPPDASAYDMARVEVLRGPQGTLYGASALNGVVRVLTHEPNLNEFEFKARTAGSGTEGGDESYRADAALNVPIIDGALAVRAVVGFQDIGGWLNNPNKRDANDTEVNNYRLRIAAQPTDRLSLGFLTWISRTNSGAPTNSPNGDTRPSILDERSSTDFDIFGFNVGYDFDGFTFTSSTSSIDYDNNGRFDYRPFSPSTPFDPFLNFVAKSEVFAQEFALTSTGDGDWRWSLGAIYRNGEDYTFTTRTNASTGALVTPTYLAPTIETRNSESIAVFGEITRVLFDGQLELTAGLRQFHDETQYDEVSNRLVAGGVPAAGLVHSTGEFDKLTPRLVATWHPSRNATLYASYAQGFRSGLSQTASAGALGYPAVEPDELTNYEIGHKASAWGGRVNFETALYYIDWQNLQQNQNVILNTTPSLVLGVATINAGSASGLGFEAGISAEVVHGLTLSGNFSWNGLEVDQNVFDTGAVLIYPKGGRISNSPEYTAAASADYVWPLGGGFDGHLSVSANYMPEMIQSAGTFSAIRDEAFFARASFALEAPGHWSASLFVENLTNEEAISYDPFATLTNPPHVWDTYERPRTFGVQLQYRY